LAHASSLGIEGFDTRYLDGSTWNRPGEPVKHIETHAAHVFLCGNEAYKIKKQVHFSYLDFSTINKRRSVLEYELALNRAFAPNVYKAVTHVFGEPVLVMRRFEDSSLLSNIVRERALDEETCDKLAALIAKSHGEAPPSNVRGGDVMLGLGKQLENAFRSNPKLFLKSKEDNLSRQFQESLETLWPLFNVRSAKGLVRHCHGDLHCENIIIENGEPMLFDAIEFNDRIAIIDVLYDLAFLLMDLIHFGQQRAANLILNTYLDLRREQEDLSGLATLRLFLATRAGVRALVAADRLSETPKASAEEYRDRARLYFDASAKYILPVQPKLVCIGGLSGSGKSTLAKHLARSIEPVPGALLVRSDIERKLLAGIPAKRHLPPEHYTLGASIAVYDAIVKRARSAILAGHSVILDAVFAREEERQMVEKMAHDAHVNFFGFWLDAPLEMLKERVSSRVNDASDATPNIVDVQYKLPLGNIGWKRLDASGSLNRTAASIMTDLDQTKMNHHAA
jgi:aminoglycoside phosphotransferase family enzyme/predicted kinase